jgi:pyruvate formate lyase activating enzyme
MSCTNVHEQTGIVFNIQRFSVHDGTGIRTVVFLKGCPMRCRWCCNPESQNPEPEIAYNANRCLGREQCGHCLKYDTKNDAVKNCPTQALFIYGERKTVSEVLDEVEKDSVFYSRSGGGLTLSGGEPFYQADFALALLQEAKRRHIHTAAETAGFVSTDVLLQACSYLDELLFDIKMLSPEKHEEYTGVPLDLILDNFRTVKETYPHLPVLVRTPVIPDVNDSPEDIARIKEFVQRYPLTQHETLPYHRFGEQKYVYLAAGKDG